MGIAQEPCGPVGGTVLILFVGVVGAVAAVGVLSLALLWRLQERVVFQPPRGVVVPVDDAVPVTYEAADGHRLTGYLVGGEHGAVAGSALSGGVDRPMVLAFHGNAELAAWLLPWAREVSRRADTRVFLAEYRGYADLPGPPSYKVIQADARAALSFMEDQIGVAPGRYVLFGHSLGSAVAAELAVTARAAALVLQAPFSSAQAMAARLLVPALPGFWNWFSRVHYNTSAVVAGVNCPVFVAHGEEDMVVPVAMGRHVYGSARVQGALLVCPDAGHNDVAERGGERYWAWLSSAISCARALESRSLPDTPPH